MNKAMKTKSWKDVRRTLSPDAEARIAAELARVRAAMPLHELRKARELTQAALAEAMDDQQSAVSRLEKQTDMYISTLRRYVEAMGGDLEIVARFPDGAVRINQFQGE